MVIIENDIGALKILTKDKNNSIISELLMAKMNSMAFFKTYKQQQGMPVIILIAMVQFLMRSVSVSATQRRIIQFSL